jgi:hypothetical protein
VNFKEATREAARIASKAASDIMEQYSLDTYVDEDDITPALVESLRSNLSGQIHGLTWKGAVFRHRRGVANEEGITGADFALFFDLNTPTHKFKKGVLLQAKRFERSSMMSNPDWQRLQNQCGKMLAITPSAFVFNFSKSEMRSAPASKISGCATRALYEECDWTAYRFFLEFFRCPVGDPRFVSAHARDLPIPFVLELTATGELYRG